MFVFRSGLPTQCPPTLFTPALLTACQPLSILSFYTTPTTVLPPTVLVQSKLEKREWIERENRRERLGAHLWVTISGILDRALVITAHHWAVGNQKSPFSAHGKKKKKKKQGWWSKLKAKECTVHCTKHRCASGWKMALWHLWPQLRQCPNRYPAIVSLLFSYFLWAFKIKLE